MSPVDFSLEEEEEEEEEEVVIITSCISARTSCGSRF